MSTLSITWHLVLGFLDRTSDCICEIVSRHISYPVNNAMHSQIKATSREQKSYSMATNFGRKIKFGG